MGKLMDKLADRLNQLPELQDLDSSTLGKAHPDMAPSLANARPGTLFMVHPPTKPMIGCPTQVLSRGSQAANAEIKLGSDSGALVFQPDSDTTSSLTKTRYQMEWKQINSDRKNT